MAKQHKAHEQGAALELIGTPDELINVLISKKKDKEAAINAIVNEGPKHKQLYSALLLKRMYALVKQIEEQTEQAFTIQEGTLLASHKDEVEVAVPLVLEGFHSKDEAALSEALSHAPAHEIAAFNTLLQAIAWSIAAIGKSNQMNKN